MTNEDNDPSDNNHDDLMNDYLQEDIDPNMQVLPPEKVIRPGVGMTTALLMSLVAAIAGALGGAAIAEVIRYKNAPDVQNIQTQIDTLSSERESLNAQLSRTQSQVQTLSAKKPANLSGLEARLKTLEDKPAPDNKNMQNLETRLKAIEAIPRRAERAVGNADAEIEGIAEGYVSGDIEARVDILERRSSPYDMTDILERLDRLEVQSVAPAASPEVKAKPLVKTLVIPPLPQNKILAAIDEQDNESGSWVGRALKKHVSIRDAGTDSPKAILADIQSAMDNDDYAVALKAFERLPSRARSAASDWQAAVEAKLKDNP